MTLIQDLWSGNRNKYILKLYLISVIDPNYVWDHLLARLVRIG